MRKRLRFDGTAYQPLRIAEFLSFATSAMGGYVELYIATPMHRTELCRAVSRHRTPTQFRYGLKPSWPAAEYA
jgi:hypothetical protein